MFGTGGGGHVREALLGAAGDLLVLSGKWSARASISRSCGLQDPVNGIRPNRMLLSPDPAGMASLRAGHEAGHQERPIRVVQAFGLFHSGRADEGIRDDRDEFSMQIGVGKDGAFVDVDHYKPEGLAAG